ncbi:MAG: HEAT repeat domain-containing protein [Cyanobacteria bacterium P01_F01_bin.33]
MNPSPVESAPLTVVTAQSPPPNPRLMQAIEDLYDGDFQARWDAAKVIQTFGLQAVEPLLATVQNCGSGDPDDADPDDELLWFLARIFGDWRSPRALTALADLLATTTDDDTVAMVGKALAKQGSAAIPLLQDMADNAARKKVAYRALACISHPDVLPILQTAATDTDADVRVIALDVLGHWRAPLAAELLVAALGDGVAAVRQVAIAGLSAQLTLATESDDDAGERDVWLNALGARLEDPDLAVAERAALALSRSKSALAATMLGERLQVASVPANLQCAIARSLVWIATPHSLTHLQAALPQLEPAACHEVIAALGRLETLDLRPLATDLLLDVLAYYPALSVESRAALAHSLGLLSETRALPVLQQLSRDSEERVQWHAIAALERLSVPLQTDCEVG